MNRIQIVVSLLLVSLITVSCAGQIDDAYKKREWSNVMKIAQESIAKGDKDGSVYRYLGIAQAATGDTLNAVENLKKAISESKKDGRAVLQLTQIYISQNRIIEAKQIAMDGIKASGKSLDMQAARALALAYTDSISEASSLIWKVTSSDSTNATYYKIQGLISRKEGVVDFVIESFQRALRLDPNDNDIRYELGLAYLFAKRGGDALETFKKVHELEPGFPGVNFRIGQLLYYNARGDSVKLKESLPYLDAAAKENPSAEVYRLIGETYARLNRVAEAETALKASLSKKDDPSVRKLCADLFMVQKKFDVATEYWRPLAGTSDFDAARYLKLTDMTQAYWGHDTTKHPVLLNQCELLKKGWETDRTNANLLTRIGLLYYAIDQYDSAIVWLKKKIDNEPNSASAWINLGYAFNGLERSDEAIAALRKGLALNDSSIAPYQVISDILQRQKLEKDAVALLDSLSSRKDFDLKWWMRLAMLHYNMKQYSKAIQTLEKADGMYPNSADVWVWIGINRYSQYAAEPGRTELLNRTKEAFRKALQFDPENADAKNYLNQLSK
ncbi:MAG: tetratricopeptide repeat protein [bacterium]|nr:tetratricopeptide repeat protein [bacterium]